MDEMTLTLNSPITEEQWDMIEDVDFDHTDSITFYTKHGKEVEFVKRKTGKWFKQPFKSDKYVIFRCSECLQESGFGHIESKWANFCPNCGARMQEGEDNERA